MLRVFVRYRERIDILKCCILVESGKPEYPGKTLGERARTSSLFLLPTYVTDHPWIRTRAGRLKMGGGVWSNHQGTRPRGTHPFTSFSRGKLLQQPQFCFANDISNVKFKEAKFLWIEALLLTYLLCYVSPNRVLVFFLLNTDILFASWRGIFRRSIVWIECCGCSQGIHWFFNNNE